MQMLNAKSHVKIVKVCSNARKPEKKLAGEDICELFFAPRKVGTVVGRYSPATLAQPHEAKILPSFAVFLRQQLLISFG
jgi:hypothetical protein